VLHQEGGWYQNDGDIEGLAFNALITEGLNH
jgi:hypothetical protein